MNLEAKIAQYVELRQKIEELENQKKTVAAEVLELMPKESSTISVSGYRVKRASFLSIKTSLESAHQLNAVIMKEVVDKDKIKKLFLSGQNPPDVSEFHFIQVYGDKMIHQDDPVS